MTKQQHTRAVMIDYARMQRRFPVQKRALTRALSLMDAGDRQRAVVATCSKTVQEWDEIGAWPDDWARWQRALDEVGLRTRLEELA